MKNRYYGDKKDYIKYGLLDVLSADYRSLGINWYLTDDHHGNQNHGHDLTYLNDNSWERCNPRIFNLLKQRVENAQRNVNYCRLDQVIPIRHEVTEQLPENFTQEDYEEQRSKWHSKAKEALSECDLIFFDPDIGVKDQLPNNPIQASQYCRSLEIKDYYKCDWLLIQFLQLNLPKYDQLFSNPVSQTALRLNKKVIVFISGSVAFLYVSERIKINILQQIFSKWNTKISTYILIS